MFYIFFVYVPLTILTERSSSSSSSRRPCSIESAAAAAARQLQSRDKRIILFVHHSGGGGGEGRKNPGAPFELLLRVSPSVASSQLIVGYRNE